MKQWQKDLVSQVHTKLPNLTKLALVTATYNGMIRGEDYFITVEPAVNNHPLYDFMQDNEYLKRISTGMKLQVISNERDNYTVAAPTSTNVFDPSKLTELVPKYELEQDFSLGNAVEHKRTTGTYGRGPNPSLTITSSGASFNFGGIERGVRDATVINIGSKTVRPVNFAKRKDMWYAYPDPTVAGFWQDSRAYLNKVGAFKREAVTSLGCMVRFESFLEADVVEYRNDVTVNLPPVNGTRRWFYFYAVQNGIVGVGGYLLGEGEDTAYINLEWTLRDVRYSVSYDNELTKIVTQKTEVPLANTRRVSWIKNVDLWPLSWNSQFVDSVQGDFAFSELAEMKNMDNMRVFEQTVNVNVTKLTGHMNKSDYLSYIATGYDLFPPLTGEELTKATKSWESVPPVLNFAIERINCMGRSFKELPYYSEYGRKRAKACKDNNFMELKYNDEFTFKQVENKLSSLTSLDVWVADASLSSSLGGDGVVTVPETTRVTTITKIDEQSFKYVVNDAALSGTVVLSESTVGAFVDKVMPSKFAGDVAMLDAFLAAEGGSTLQDYANEAAGKQYSKFNLNMSAYGYGTSLTYTEVCDNLNVTGQIAFLASQVTDFRHFNTQVPLLVKSLQGVSAYPVAAEKFNFA